jgi:hypothetical protein
MQKMLWSFSALPNLAWIGTLIMVGYYKSIETYLGNQIEKWCNVEKKKILRWYGNPTRSWGEVMRSWGCTLTPNPCTPEATWSPIGGLKPQKNRQHRKQSSTRVQCKSFPWPSETWFTMNPWWRGLRVGPLYGDLQTQGKTQMQIAFKSLETWRI